MTRDAEIRCRCGEVHGRVKNASQKTVNRVVCYCADCQAFLHHLGRAEFLDASGGSDIVQIAPASLSFERGNDRVVGLRLSPNGLYRWYASCCKMPMGNSLKPSVPFIGILVHSFDGGAERADDTFGKPVGAIAGKSAVGSPPPGSTGVNVRLLARAVRRVVGWKVRGGTWPHPYFDRTTGEPNREVTVLTREQREALRPLCGPLATSVRRATT